jgi:hypothetical protein
MKTIIKISSILLVMLTIATNFACNKSKTKAPFGENIIKYTLNGVENISGGPYNQITLTGIKNGLQNSPRRFGGSFDNNTSISINDLPAIGTVLNYSLVGLTTSVDKTIYLSTKNKQGKTISYMSSLNSGFVSISDNSASFIAGTFNCILYQDTTWLMPYDSTSPASIQLTNGYFDISNK